MGIIRSMTKEMIKEIGNKSREFYEFVLPPVDMHFDGSKLTAIIDLPGFKKEEIKLTVTDDILSIYAKKHDEKKDDIICSQRPNVIDKKIHLPIHISEDEEITSKYSDGILTLTLPVSKKGRDISIE